MIACRWGERISFRLWSERSLRFPSTISKPSSAVKETTSREGRRSSRLEEADSAKRRPRSPILSGTTLEPSKDEQMHLPWAQNSSGAAGTGQQIHGDPSRGSRSVRL